MSKKPDLGIEVSFHDPHPGLLGAAACIPEDVRRVATALDGTTMTLGEALALIGEVTKGEVRAVPEHRYVSLRIEEPDGTIHVFRVIRYREKAG